MIAITSLKLLKFIHENSIIHRDIKPNNFLIGINNQKKRIFLVDFGLAKKYRNKKGEHIKFQAGKSFIGTARYSSISAALGNQQSRRDDLESLAYMLVYFLKG